jgi:hypothetical protein
VTEEDCGNRIRKASAVNQDACICKVIWLEVLDNKPTGEKGDFVEKGGRK